MALEGHVMNFDKEIKPSTLNWVAIVASAVGIILLIFILKLI